MSNFNPEPGPQQEMLEEPRKAVVMVGGSTRGAIADILIQRAYHSMLSYGERQHRSPMIGAMSANIEKAKPVDSRQVRRAKERQKLKR